MSATLPTQLEGFSQALYATWVWYRPFRLLFDCGEGVAVKLQNSVFAVRWVLLSHGHLDHLGGLPSLVNIRNNGLGDNQQPLTIVHPADDVFVDWMRDYLRRSAHGDLELEWRAVRPGDRLPLEASRVVEAFAARHVPGQPALGYRVLDQRRRRRPELAACSEAELAHLAREGGREAVSEPYEHPLLVYGGDGLPPAPAQMAGADVVVLDATFLRSEDRGRPTHATVDEAVAAATAAGVGTLVLCHLSGRYSWREARQVARRAALDHGFGGQLAWLWQDRLQIVAVAAE